MNKAYRSKNMGKNGSKLTLYPLRFEQAVRDLLKAKPEAKIKEGKK